MTRRYFSFPIADQQQTKMQMLNWGNRFNICCFLDNHNYHLSHSSIECVLACGTSAHLEAQAGNALESLSSFMSGHRDWIFGHLAYDLKNEIERLSSSNPDHIGFPDLFFFVPRYIIKLSESSFSIGSFENDHDQILSEILAIVTIDNENSDRTSPPQIHSRYSREQYVDIVQQLRKHILRGDCYEINFCQEFFVDNININPLTLYSILSRSSPNPFSAYYKFNNRYLACMSPERYLKKQGRNILSQPIKGTSKRSPESREEDLETAINLKTSEKERAENIMVVDLVRNDLSRISEHGSVKVDELCEVYTFPQVHQMISTVSGTLKDNVDFATAIRATFPMGSMTGAPKKKVMQLIEKYEVARRGLFSGSIGYIDPEGNFDFNVVIRSVLYNASTGYLSFQTGSGITFNSDPYAEYDECLLKADAIKKALAETNTFH